MNTNEYTEIETIKEFKEQSSDTEVDKVKIDIELSVLMNLIEESYYDNRYKDTLLYLDEYLNNKFAGISFKIFNIYINCLIKSGLFEDVDKNIEIMLKLFPQSYDEIKLANMYARFGQIDKLDDLMKKGNFSEKDYYSIAVKCFYSVQHDKAKELFLKFISLSNNENLKNSAREYIEKIEMYKTNKNVFVAMNYSYFISKGNELSLGDVIHVSKVRRSAPGNKYIDDPKKEKRSYMVWKVKDDKIYAFPITISPDERAYIIKKENYPNFPYDRAIGSNIVCLYEHDIDSVIDKISEEDCEKSLERIYRLLCFNPQKFLPNQQRFMDGMVRSMDIEENDVIVVYDEIQKKNLYYLIIDIDQNKKKYKVLKLKCLSQNNYQIYDLKLTKITIPSRVAKIIKLDEESKSKLFEEVPDNYQNTNIVGSIVGYDFRQLEVISENEKFYICIDTTSEKTSSNIELIKKDTPLFIIHRLSKEVHERNLQLLKSDSETTDKPKTKIKI